MQNEESNLKDSFKKNICNANSLYMTLCDKKLCHIIESSFDGIYITDGKGNTLSANKSYESITGIKVKDVLGKNMRELVKKNIISISGSLIAIKEHRVITLEQEFKTGKKALITSSPVYDEDGNIIMVVTNVRDITELYTLKEEIQKRNEVEAKLIEELEHLKKDSVCHDMIVQDKSSLTALLLANKVAPLDATVMLNGETGVGKEVFANYIYKNSKRNKMPFIKVNCSAIPESLIESVLFGYEKGSFTGANKDGKMGLFEVADKGTLFLDEVGELPLSMQVKLLRVLQEQEIERIGGTQPIKIDVRIIAATNRNLEEMVKNSTFREDLYYRLMVFPISIPPLRNRKHDIEPLASLFVNNLNKKYGFNKSLSDNAINTLLMYSWPGNIRELKNVIERSIIISNEDIIDSSDLSITNNAGSKKHHNSGEKNLKDEIEAIELKYINEAFKKYGNVRDAAISIGMSPSTFVRKRRKYNQNI